MTLPELRPSPWPGCLIVFEGTARAGKSTAIEALQAALRDRGLDPVISGWNSVPAINALILERKREMSYTPLTWSLLHLTDFALRYEETIVPTLKRGGLVIADRYVFTALTRDVLRGLSEDYVGACYGFAVKPNLVFYLHVPAEVALERHRQTTGTLYPHSSGLDIWPGLPLEEGYLRYQAELHRLYLAMAPVYGLHLLDGTSPPETILERILGLVLAGLEPAARAGEAGRLGAPSAEGRGFGK
jgi:dTMP kinase